ncbi:hypothetical protein JEQ12_016007 [Ovis aries]|uniref:RING-type domain-containing protein n=1 Tax=Ovis aries TaxID=9940 RepID=A0A836ABC3_SHEEP|nr:hypothetical protein JEQ12_016007 [Ovis aries]
MRTVLFAFEVQKTVLKNKLRDKQWTKGLGFKLLSHQCAPVRIPVCALWGPAAAALALPAGPGEAACTLCQSAPRDPVRADCGHRFCRACVVRFWAEEDGPFPCPECADDCWQRAVEPGRPPLSRRLLALEEAAAAPTRDGPASEAALQLLCRADGGPLCAACRMAAGPEPPEWEPRWRKALRGKGHVMDRRKKALTDYKKLRAFFAEEEGRFLQEAEKEEGSLEDEDEDPAERFRSLLQAVSELERRHRNLGLNMLLQSERLSLTSAHQAYHVAMRMESEEKCTVTQQIIYTQRPRKGVLFLTSFPSLSSIFSGSCPSPGKDTTGRKRKAMAAGPLLWGVQIGRPRLETKESTTKPNLLKIYLMGVGKKARPLETLRKCFPSHRKPAPSVLTVPQISASSWLKPFPESHIREKPPVNRGLLGPKPDMFSQLGKGEEWMPEDSLGGFCLDGQLCAMHCAVCPVVP